MALPAVSVAQPASAQPARSEVSGANVDVHVALQAPVAQQARVVNAVVVDAAVAQLPQPIIPPQPIPAVPAAPRRPSVHFSIAGNGIAVKKETREMMQDAYSRIQAAVQARTALPGIAAGCIPRLQISVSPPQFGKCVIKYVDAAGVEQPLITILLDSSYDGFDDLIQALDEGQLISADKVPSYKPGFEGSANGRLTLVKETPFLKSLLVVPGHVDGTKFPVFERFSDTVLPIIFADPRYNHQEKLDILQKLEKAQAKYACRWHYIDARRLQVQADRDAARIAAPPAAPAVLAAYDREIKELNEICTSLEKIDWFAAGLAIAHPKATEDEVKAILLQAKAAWIGGQGRLDKAKGLLDTNFKGNKLSDEELQYCKDIIMLNKSRWIDSDYFDTHRDPIERHLLLNMGPDARNAGVMFGLLRSLPPASLMNISNAVDTDANLTAFHNHVDQTHAGLMLAAAPALARGVAPRDPIREWRTVLTPSKNALGAVFMA